VNTYQKTLEWMYAQLPMYQLIGEKAFKNDLSNILLLSDYLKNPEKSFKSIHVAGTNGKGSTSHMVASVLQEAGYKVGLYTSPHLKDFRERIKVNRIMISEEEVCSFFEQHKPFFEANSLSFFEMTVGLAFMHFKQEKVDLAVVEVGLGGRLDATNIITPLVSVITNIGFDHVKFLGNTLPEIAFEKAGIIKDEVPVVIGEFQKETYPVFQKKANEHQSQLYNAFELDNHYKSDLKGNYQEKNLKTAVKTIELLRLKNFKITEDHLKNGLLQVVKNTKLKGRWQVIQQQPTVICDTAHNQEGLRMVMLQLQEQKFNNLHIVFGSLNDKDLNSILPLLPLKAIYYFCKPNTSRGLDAKDLQLEAQKFGLHGNAYNSVMDSLNAALYEADSEDLIFVGGSTFVVAEVV